MADALLDTNAISDLVRDHAEVKAHIAQHSGAIATNAVVAGEISYGLNRLPVGRKRSDLEVRARTILSSIRIEPVSAEVAETYGRVRASLDAQGLIVNDNDLWIAVTALTLGLLLVSRDQIFTRIPNLQVVDWTV